MVRKDYTFNKTAKTVTFVSPVSIDRISLITIKTGTLKGTIIYNFAKVGLGGTLVGQVLTLDYDTTVLATDESLQINYDDERVGLGNLTACPAATANGAAIGTVPAFAKAVRLYLNSGDAITFTIANAAPGSPPSATVTLNSVSISNWDEPLSEGMNLYITSKTGNPLFRFI